MYNDNKFLHGHKDVPLIESHQFTRWLTIKEADFAVWIKQFDYYDCKWAVALSPKGTYAMFSEKVQERSE